MDYKKVAVLIIIVVVLVGGGLSFYLYRNSVLNKSAKSVDNIQETLNSVEIKDKKIADNITYPYIAQADGFNKLTQDLVQKELDDFKTNSLENDEAVKKVDPESYAKYPREYTLNISYTTGEMDGSVTSVILNVENFEGGAHGATNFIPINYDVKNKKNIKLADLFTGQKDYLQKISDYCIEDLKKQIKEKTGDDGGAWLEDGAGPFEENYSVFLINPSTSSGQATITFYFPQYQVAAYALGNFKVTYPR